MASAQSGCTACRVSYLRLRQLGAPYLAQTRPKPACYSLNDLKSSRSSSGLLLTFNLPFSLLLSLFATQSGWFSTARPTTILYLSSKFSKLSIFTVVPYTFWSQTLVQMQFWRLLYTSIKYGTPFNSSLSPVSAIVLNYGKWLSILTILKLSSFSYNINLGNIFGIGINVVKHSISLSILICDLLCRNYIILHCFIFNGGFGGQNDTSMPISIFCKIAVLWPR